MDVATALQAVDAACRGDRQDVERVVDCLQRLLHRYSWVGIYVVQRDDLVLAAWQGPDATEHVRIPIGRGVCGAAAASGVTEIVDDVNADPRYLACFPSTRSEIVVPIRFCGEVVGEIDIDSDLPYAFTRHDRDFLEQVALRIAPAVRATKDALTMHAAASPEHGRSP